MLCLTRSKFQKIMIGADVIVTVLEIRGNKVVLGIDCARDVQVDRSEVRDSKNKGERR